MKKTTINVAIVLLIIAVVLIGIVTVKWLSNPYRKTEAEVRDYILEITPIGTSKEDVIKFIEENAQRYKDHRKYEWFAEYMQFDYGFAINNGHVALRYHGYEYEDSEMIGVETIEAAVDCYTKFFEVTVFSCWAFDEHGNLVDVGVYKSSDSF